MVVSLQISNVFAVKVRLQFCLYVLWIAIEFLQRLALLAGISSTGLLFSRRDHVDLALIVPRERNCVVLLFWLVFLDLNSVLSLIQRRHPTFVQGKHLF